MTTRKTDKFVCLHGGRQKIVWAETYEEAAQRAARFFEAKPHEITITSYKNFSSNLGK